MTGIWRGCIVGMVMWIVIFVCIKACGGEDKQGEIREKPIIPESGISENFYKDYSVVPESPEIEPYAETEFCQSWDIIGTYLCPTTTTSILPEPIPEYCGEIGVVELNKLLSPIFKGNYYGHDRKIFWDEQYRLISKRSLDDFLKWYEVPSLGNEGADCADYCRIMQGHFSEWSPNTAFGMVVVGWNEETDEWARHCKNIMVDCEHRIYFIESQGGRITLYDEEADTLIMGVR